MAHAPPKMASLISLPDEIIIHVVTNSGLKSRRLYNLLLVNRYFSTLTLPLLYRDVKLLWMGDHESSSFFRFQETIEKFPERALLVRSLKISCDRYDDGEMDIFFGHNSPMNLLLGRLEFLEELTVTSPMGVLWPPQWLQSNPAPALTHVRLLFPIVEFLGVRKYLFHPNLKYLELSTLPSPINLGRNTTSGLRRLRLKTRGFCDSAVEILRCCNVLTEFTCVVVGVKSQLHQFHTTSPSRISSSLLLVGQNIATLNLTIEDEHPVENSMLNLRDHRALRELAVHCNLLFGSGACYQPTNRHGLSKCLPSSLERLKILFPPFQAAFRQYYISTPPDGSMQNNPSLAPSDVDCSEWVLELLDTKGYGTAFPRLDHVHMVEDCTIMPVNHTAWDKEGHGKYEVLDSIRDAFEKADVELSITFKVIESLDDWISPALR